MDNRFKRCLDEKKIVKAENTGDLVEKELMEAEFDLNTAETSIEESNPKWATVQAYYSMFHTAKALVLSKGYMEKSHTCLAIALKALYVDDNRLETKHYERFRDCMNLRHDADYGGTYSEPSAEDAAGWAREFLEDAKQIIENRKQ